MPGRGRSSRVRSARAAAAVLVLAGCMKEAQKAAPGEPLVGLTDGEYGRFLQGRAVFERRATEEEGLGPLFNGERCSTCHQEPAVGGTSGVLVHKASRYRDGRCDVLGSEGGDNIQQRATALLRSAGLGPEAVPPSATEETYLVAPPLYGLGLLEAIPEGTLAALADPEDRDADGVSGRLPRAADGRVGRFGYKADSPDIAHFVDTALRFELGFTTPGHPVEERVNGEPLPEGVDPMPEPEIDERGVGLLVEFVRFLAPPAGGEEPPAGDTIEVGRSTFREVGCASCHVPELDTGPSEVDALSKKRVPLYSDLLLHDMGPGLAGTCAGSAAPTEYRTAPLWGLARRFRFLHDGGARTLREAVERHGGEAESAREAFLALDPEERTILLRFVGSL